MAYSVSCNGIRITHLVKKGVVEKARAFAEFYKWTLQWASLFIYWKIRHGSTVLIVRAFIRDWDAGDWRFEV